MNDEDFCFDVVVPLEYTSQNASLNPHKVHDMAEQDANAQRSILANSADEARIFMKNLRLAFECADDFYRHI